MSRKIAVLAAFLLLAAPALAQPAPGLSTRIAGTVEQFDGAKLAVKTRDGREVTVAVPAGLAIGAVADRSLADIKPGEYVGSAAVPGKDGRLHAQEVHIFPASRRGTGEGHFPMSGPQQTMTNADVSGVAGSPDGQVLTLTYPGGQQQIVVGPGVRVVEFIQGDRSLLKPGAAVVVSALSGPAGVLTARSVQAEKNGVKPLM